MALQPWEFITSSLRKWYFFVRLVNNLVGNIFIWIWNLHWHNGTMACTVAAASNEQNTNFMWNHRQTLAFFEHCVRWHSLYETTASVLMLSHGIHEWNHVKHCVSLSHCAVCTIEALDTPAPTVCSLFICSVLATVQASPLRMARELFSVLFVFEKRLTKHIALICSTRSFTQRARFCMYQFFSIFFSMCSVVCFCIQNATHRRHFPNKTNETKYNSGSTHG